MEKRIAFYTRVSTADQTTDNQLLQLDQWIDRAGYRDGFVDHYSDHAVSGRRTGRPGLTKLERAVATRKVNIVAVVALDRLGRSLQHLTRLLAEFEALDCQLVTLREGMDTSTPAGRAMLHMAGVFAEFESHLIAERTKAALARVKAQGKRLGPPRLPHATIRTVEAALQEGQSVRAICAQTGVGRGTVYRVRQTMTEEAT
jgi:DNA invertase Pin-like site-specific DNA recombinase